MKLPLNAKENLICQGLDDMLTVCEDIEALKLEMSLNKEKANGCLFALFAIFPSQYSTLQKSFQKSLNEKNAQLNAVYANWLAAVSRHFKCVLRYNEPKRFISVLLKRLPRRPYYYIDSILFQCQRIRVLSTSYKYKNTNGAFQFVRSIMIHIPVSSSTLSFANVMLIPAKTQMIISSENRDEVRLSKCYRYTRLEENPDSCPAVHPQLIDHYRVTSSPDAHAGNRVLNSTLQVKLWDYAQMFSNGGKADLLPEFVFNSDCLTIHLNDAYYCFLADFVPCLSRPSTISRESLGKIITRFEETSTFLEKMQLDLSPR